MKFQFLKRQLPDGRLRVVSPDYPAIDITCLPGKEVRSAVWYLRMHVFNIEEKGGVVTPPKHYYPSGDVYRAVGEGVTEYETTRWELFSVDMDVSSSKTLNQRSDIVGRGSTTTLIDPGFTWPCDSNGIVLANNITASEFRLTLEPFNPIREVILDLDPTVKEYLEVAARNMLRDKETYLKELKTAVERLKEAEEEGVDQELKKKEFGTFMAEMLKCIGAQYFHFYRDWE